jgi:hypothetical protein
MVPENARSAFAMRVSKMCFLIYSMKGFASHKNADSRSELTDSGVATAR